MIINLKHFNNFIIETGATKNLTKKTVRWGRTVELGL
jgi:hypothetical protein